MTSEALQERLTRLSEASLRINESLDFDQVLQGVLDAARSLTAARYGVMTLLDDAGGVRDEAPTRSLFEWALEQEQHEGALAGAAR